jgi:hypothetical protein
MVQLHEHVLSLHVKICKSINTQLWNAELDLERQVAAAVTATTCSVQFIGRDAAILIAMILPSVVI